MNQDRHGGAELGFQPANFRHHPVDLVRQPDVILIAEREIRSIASIHQPRKVPGRAEISTIVAHNSDLIRMGGRPSGDDLRRLVTRVVVANDDDEITVGLIEQIQSLLDQTYRDFVIIVRDDHSGDKTPEIIARWAAAHPDKIRVVCDDRGNLRSAGNFSRLMDACDAPYFAFSDQDDVWLPNKIDRMMAEVRRLETEFGATVPILVHSDLRVVDAELREISPSFFHYLQTDLRKARRLPQLIVNNIVTGCAVMGNRALLDIARPIPADAFVHDWW